MLILQINQIKFTYYYFLEQMAQYLDKDFFGDPFWPSQVNSPKSQLNQFDKNDSPNKKLFSKQISNPIEKVEDAKIEQDRQYNGLDIDQGYFLNQKKLIYSNFKHSQITYLQDYTSKFNQTQKSSQNIIQKSGEQCEDILANFRKFQIKLEKDLMQNVKSKKRSSKRDVLYPFEYQKDRKLQNDKEDVKEQQDKMLEQILNDEYSIKEQNIQKKLEIEEKILQKLQFKSSKQKPIKEMEGNLVKQQIQTKQKIKLQADCYQKGSKYKILTQNQKQYLVFLSTISTTCQVARKFNISVNNICRWKKGCRRKLGAGRKITNRKLQLQVIDFVKTSMRQDKLLTRRLIQSQAKQLSQDQNFKASKGWFQRFYNRNIQIFKKIPPTNDVNTKN